MKRPFKKESLNDTHAQFLNQQSVRLRKSLPLSTFFKQKKTRKIYKNVKKVKNVTGIKNVKTLYYMYAFKGHCTVGIKQRKRKVLSGGHGLMWSDSR